MTGHAQKWNAHVKAMRMLIPFLSDDRKSESVTCLGSTAHTPGKLCHYRCNFGEERCWYVGDGVPWNRTCLFCHICKPRKFKFDGRRAGRIEEHEHGKSQDPTD